MEKSVNKNIIAFVLFLSGITIGIVLVDKTRSSDISTATLSTKAPEHLGALCEDSAAIRDLSSNQAGTRREFKVTDVAATPIADRGLLCHVKGKMTNHLAGGRYSEFTTERFALVSARTGESELISEDVFKYLQGSNVIKTLASNKAEKPTKKLAVAQ